jgi:hypothetical protein
MAVARGSDLGGTAALRRLAELADSPAEQVAHALRLVDKERNVDAVLAALRVLEREPVPHYRTVLLRRYGVCDDGGSRRDQGGMVRIAILRVLREVALPGDAPLFERAATTYEFMYGEAAGDLRGAGLLTLNVVDDRLAGYHAVRLLTDQYTSLMTGEPAVSAVRVLALQGQHLPLYAYVSRDGPAIADVVAEALRSLTTMPVSLVPALVKRYGESEDGIVLLGLFDLLLGHRERETFRGFIENFLRSTRQYDIYRYLVSTLVAGADDAWLSSLRAMVTSERDRAKVEILREALALR